MVVRILLQVLLGVTLGGILGALITGDWLYTIVWAVGMSVTITFAALLGSRSSRRASRPPVTATVPGIIQRMTGMPASTASVLNPEPTARPAAPTVLNGVPLETQTPPPSGDDPRRVPWWSRALALTVILAAAAATLIPAYRTIGWIAGDIAQGRWDGRDMRVGIHQQEAIDDIAAVVGGYEFTRVNFYDSYVIVDAPTTPGADTTDTYLWRYGRAWREGPEFIQPTDLASELFDASEIDFSLVGELTREAMADTGWPSFESSYPSVIRSSADGPVIVISLTSSYYSASYTFSVEGELLTRTGTGIN